tara:strand:- start:130269 stop:131474 length:1206 start_codon:yes stop_codon:yes gene_type:complete
MVDFTLSEEQRELQKTGRRFAAQEIAPLAARVGSEGLDACEDDIRSMFARGVELGFTSLLIPESVGGGGMRCIDNAILLEELAVGDIAIAADLFSLNACMPLVMQRGGTPQQQAYWMEKLTSGEPIIMSGAQSEPNVSGGDLFSPDPSHGMRTSAKLDGDEWVINGNKSAFVTNAGAADYYMIMARTEPNKVQMESVSMFLIDANTPGFSVSPRTELIGWQTTHHAELLLDNVRVPKERLLGREGGALPTFAQIPEMGICLAACFVGLARRAYEYALAYAQERVSWGRPIIEHQSVALKLAEMSIDVETARLLVWDAAAAIDTDPMAAGTIKGPGAKSHAVDVAIRTSQRAMEILGAYGVAKEYPTGGFLNDAMVGYACDFTREVLRLGMVPFLVQRSNEG